MAGRTNLPYLATARHPGDLTKEPSHIAIHLLNRGVVKPTYYINGEIEKWFDQSDLAVVLDVESLLIDAANGKDIQIIPKVVAEYF